MRLANCYRRRYIALVAVGLSSVGVSACGGGEETEVARGNGYEVMLPGGWDIDKEEREVAGFKIDSVWFGDTIDGFRANVNVGRETSLRRDLSLHEYVEANQRSLRNPEAASEGFKSSAVEQPRGTTLGGQDAFRFGWVNTVGVKRLRVDQVFALRGGVGYIVSYTAPPDQYRDQLDDFESILASWRWR